MGTIKVRGRDFEWYEVDGQMIGETIAVTAEYDAKLDYTGKWNVTHTPTGATFTTGQPKKTAFAMARALIELGGDRIGERNYKKAVDLFRQTGLGTFIGRAQGHPPEEVERIAQAFARERGGQPKAPVARVPAKKAPERPKKPRRPKPPPDLLALARAARKGMASHT